MCIWTMLALGGEQEAVASCARNRTPLSYMLLLKPVQVNPALVLVE